MMKNISIKEIDKKLSSFNSITEKLEYWVKNKDYVEDKYLSKMQWLLFMPEELFNNHFPNALETPEYTFFVLKYHAKKYFNSIILQKEIKGINYKIIIEEKLNDIRGHIKKVSILKIKNKPLNFSEEELVRGYSKYYETYPFNSRLTERAVHYAINVYLKEYYERELKKIESKKNKIDNHEKVKGFKTNLNPNKIKKLFGILIEKGFIAKDSDKSSFIFALTNKDKPKEFKPILWIKKSSRSKQINIKSLIDLLNLLGVNIYNFKKQANQLFAKLEEGKSVSINIKPSNMDKVNNELQPSQYYEDIKKILLKI